MKEIENEHALRPNDCEYDDDDDIEQRDGLKMKSISNQMADDGTASKSQCDSVPMISSKESIDYFDEMDDDELLAAIGGIETVRRPPNGPNDSVDAAPSTPRSLHKLSDQTAAIDLSPDRDRSGNAEHCHGDGQRDRLQSVSGSQSECEPKRRYHRFKVLEVIDDSYSRCKMLSVIEWVGGGGGTKMASTSSSSRSWTVELRADWYRSRVSESAIVHIIGSAVGVDGDYRSNHSIPVIIDPPTHFVLDNVSKNYLVVHPDILLSPSRIASSFPCIRYRLCFVLKFEILDFLLFENVEAPSSSGITFVFPKRVRCRCLEQWATICFNAFCRRNRGRLRVDGLAAESVRRWSSSLDSTSTA